MPVSQSPLLHEEISVEIFNGCAGSCTGCLLSVSDRQGQGSLMDRDAYARMCRSLADYAAAEGFDYRLVLSFGDVVLLALEDQQHLYATARDAGLTLAATMTFATEGRDAHYREAQALLVEHDPSAIFDVTVDPVRLERSAPYQARLVDAAERAPEMRFNMLLSSAVMARWSPAGLAALWLDRIGDRPVILSFTPSLATMDRRNSRFGIQDAADYASGFYADVPSAREQNILDLQRYASSGSFADFLRQRFHVDARLDVFPPAYSAFGEMTLDRRNGQTPLGNLDQTPLHQIVSGVGAHRLSTLNEVWMERGSFACGDCAFRAGCAFNGVGLARRVYRDYEDKVGSCYGPAGLAKVAPAERLLGAD